MLINQGAGSVLEKQEERGRAVKMGYSREAAPILPIILLLSLAALPALSTASTFVSTSYWERGRCYV